MTQKFDGALFDLSRRIKAETGYPPRTFVSMLAARGGLATAKALISSNRPSDGYTALFELGRLDLTVEAFVVEDPRWRALFLPEEMDKAEARLRAYGYEPVRR